MSVGTTSKTLPCSGDIVTISCRYWLSRLTFMKRAFGPRDKELARAVQMNAGGGCRSQRAMP